jgi:enamine deaminase RidA (YjgF/YER057c/UK114 family)
MTEPPLPPGRQVLEPDAAQPWARLSGGARAVRQGSRIVVSGMQARDAQGRILAPGDGQAQTALVLEQIAASLRALGAGLADVVRTRVWLRDPDACAGPAAAHARAFAGVTLATTLQGAPWLPEGCEVEIEAEADLPPPDRRFIRTGTAYEALAGYVRAVADGDWVFVSGTVGVDPVTGAWAQGTRAQAHRAIDTIAGALQRAGLGLRDVVRVVVYVASRDDVVTVSEVMRERLGPAQPTNTTLCVPLALEECRVEIEVTAKRRNG